MNVNVAELAERVERLEQEVARLKKTKEDSGDEVHPWWEEIRGIWAGDPIMKEITELGRKYRESLRPRPKRKRKKS